MRPKSSLSRRSTFFLMALIVTVSAIAATAYTLWRLRVEAIDRHSDAASTYAHAFEDHLTQTFKVINLTLVNTLANRGDEARTTYALAAALRHAPYLRSLALVDEQGTITASSESRNVGVRIVRGDFLPLTTEPRAILRAGPPWAGRDFHDGRAATPAKPLDPETQSLIPVLLDVALGNGTWTTLLASVNTDYFLNHYESSLAPNAGMVELLRYDGILLLSSDTGRKPGTRGNGDTLSRRIAKEEVGRFEQQLDDGRTVLTAYRASASYPFVIVVHLDKQSGLAGWRREATHTLAVVSAALLLAMVFASLYFVRTERAARQHDAALKQLRLRGAALDAAANSIIIADRDGTIEWANPAFCALSGYTMDEVLGHSPGELVKSGIQAPEGYQDLWSTILAGKVWRGELINRRKDNTHYLEGQTITPVCDEDGTIHHFIAVKQNITERKQAEKALQESQARLQATLDAIPDLLFELGLDGRYHHYHSPHVDLLPAPPEDLLGNLVSDVLPPDAAAVMMAALQEANERGNSIGKQIALSLPQGKMWFELSVARKPTFPHEDPRFIVLSRDITERKRSEKRMEELSRHLVVVQESARRRLSGELHDRTSPNLAAIGVNLDIITATMLEGQSPILSERIADVRALIEDTTASIREICSDLRPPILDYAGLAAALESYVKQFQRRTGIATQFDCAHPAVRLATALESVLFRIVQEALTNCAKHSRAKAILVTLKLDGAPVALTVSDDGIGFEPESLGKTTHTSGLGILTMREMAEFSGGKFILESVPGKGTRIKVEIHSMEGQT